MGVCTTLWTIVLVDFVLLAAICVAQYRDSLRNNMMMRRHGDKMEDDEHEPSPDYFFIDALMPGVIPSRSEEYVCSSFALPREDTYILGFEPKANMAMVHHMLLYGCSDVEKQPGLSYDCENMGACRGKGKILFAWARNASQPEIPRGVGFHVGGTSGLNYLTLQIHYGDRNNFKGRDHSGLSMYMTTNQQPYAGGVFLLGSGDISIRAGAKNYHADIACPYTDRTPVYPFAFRTHAHELSTVISGYRIRNGEWTILGKGNPQWPQAFYPMDRIHEIRQDDVVAARCTYNAASRHSTTYVGSTSQDEMCNFYMMYYTDTFTGETYKTCWKSGSPQLFQHIPPGSDTPPPNPPSMGREASQGEPNHYDPPPDIYGYTDDDRDDSIPNWYGDDNGNGNGNDYNQLWNKLLEKDDNGVGGENANADNGREETQEATTMRTVAGKVSDGEGVSTTVGTKTDLVGSGEHEEEDSDDLHVVEGWPADNNITLGQVAGVAVDAMGDVHIFHRADRVWAVGVFSADNHFMNEYKGRISNNTVLVFDRDTGHVKHQWGADMFFMPHGLYIDHQGNIWLTDVALHQVFKFPAGGGTTPSLVLGTELQPGSGKDHFCKPTDVATDPVTGDVFIADGYCNSRIVKFTASGKYVMEWGKASSYYGREIEVDPQPGTFSIPHSLAFIPDSQQLCVADRENGRIQCFKPDSGEFIRQYQLEEFGPRVYAISYSSWKGGVLYAVNGQISSQGNPKVTQDISAQGFTLDFKSGKLLHTWTSRSLALGQPHDVAASADMKNVYVVEIGPNRVWKFERTLDESSFGEINDHRRAHTIIDAKERLIPNAATDASIETTAIIVAVLAVPIFLMLLVAITVRLRAQGRMRFFRGDNGTAIRTGYKATDKFSLGNFFNRRKGFNQISTEDSDHDGGMGWSDDSDVEEYSILNSKRTQNL